MSSFSNSNVDLQLFRQLQDLTTVISRLPSLTFDYAYGSTVDFINQRLTASINWGINDKRIHEAGVKTDILLRTIGTLHHTSIASTHLFTAAMVKSPLSKFAHQLFALFDNVRLEEIVKRKRPGSTDLFTTRRTYLKKFFTRQLETNVTRGLALDELFCLIYLHIEANSPDPFFSQANQQQIEHLNKLKPYLFQLFEANSSKDIASIVQQLTYQIEPYYSDMVHNYFIFPLIFDSRYTSENSFEELTRTDPLSNDSQEDHINEESETFEQEFPAWHKEDKNENHEQNFLQFDLDEGNRSDLIGNGARETEEGDQALASIQGSSGKSERNNYTDLDTALKQQNKEKPLQDYSYGQENKNAIKIMKKSRGSTSSEKEQYDDYFQTIAATKRKLSRTIENMMIYKQKTPTHHLTSGRLTKKLMPIFTDTFPKIFYKKNEPSNEPDAAFTILIDCSASMSNKMEETKKSIILLHEVLQQLAVPHEIIGFWEEPASIHNAKQPNYFHMIHSFSDSLHQPDSAKIMQLEAHEDNRDGFSIRVAAENLAARRETNRFLLVFTDGEPAAVDYTDRGITDTNLAVSETRKKGMDVIGMFLAEDYIYEEDHQMMRTIYGKKHVMIPSIDQMPEHFAPILKQLLLKTI